MSTFRAEPVLTGLTEFQRRTVDHVCDLFYGQTDARRFLVADETGLGKSLVAKGVIARAVEALQERQQRTTVVYVCSNTDIARQNVKKLDVVHGGSREHVERLTLLAKHTGDLRPTEDLATRPVNLVSFTPGTTFNYDGTGAAEERALLFLLLDEELQLRGWDRRAALHVLRDGAGAARFTRRVERLESEFPEGLDGDITKAFLADAHDAGLVAAVQQAVADVGRREAVPTILAPAVRGIIASLRGVLARAGLQVLDPDLVVLDEFQRFRELLDPTTAGGELAHRLFNHSETKVLLLSATPYKPFTYAEEQGEDHHRDFLATVRFLAAGTDLAEHVATDLGAYREAAVHGAPVATLSARLRDRLLTVMSRHERPVGVMGGMHREHITPLTNLTANDLLAYVRLHQVSELVEGDVSLEYWKSTPYFANFCEGYKLSEKLRDGLRGTAGGELTKLLEALPQLDRQALAAHHEVDLGNAKLRALAEQTVDAGWWQLLWLPPSLPYLEPGGPYAQPWARDVTKRLVFSSWSATPTALAALLSARADSHLRAASRTTSGDARRLLDYRLDGDRAAALTTLALFWPMPGLARQADPLAAAGAAGGPVPRSQAETSLVRSLRGGVQKYDVAPVNAAAAVALARSDSLPDILAGRRAVLVNALGSGAEDDLERGRGVRAHVEEALRLRSHGADAPAAAVAPTVAALAAHSPANIAWRALSRVADDTVDEAQLWEAAAVLASGLRSLFNRPDVLLLLEHLHEQGAYWQKVLRYCADGNLQAVLDEHVHHLALAEGLRRVDGKGLLELARSTASMLGLRPARYGAFDPAAPNDRTFGLTSRFALRYGGRTQDADSARLPEVRQAFNSPFWPLVLASTSVGQEGIDFHWWCSALLHWNTPANPVDFEQREGRVDRYAGHAVRRNLAHRHGPAMLRASDPWQKAYKLGEDEQARLGEFAPHWVYPGPARIERHLSPYPLSVDVARLERLKTDLALYRLTFGQPRQEDMLELLRRRGVQADPERLAELRIDLSPPARG